MKNRGEKGSRHRILTPNELDLSFRAPNDYAKFHRNRPKIATVGVTTDRHTVSHTHRQTDESDFIICPMLCYSNGTDKNANGTNGIELFLH